MKRLFIYSLLIALSFGLANKVQAATISIVPDKTTVTENETFGATVYVSSGPGAINNAEGIINFPINLLSVSSVSSASSIFSIWVEQPSFSNSNGTITFNGGSPNPGFSGQYGQVLRVNFVAKNAGTAPVSFTSASVRANDGMGTDVTQGRAGTTITINKFAGIKTGEENLPQDVPTAPSISSAEIPDQTNWYSVRSATLVWPVPKDILAVEITTDRKPDSTPATVISPAIASKQINNLSDGTWYFHARFKNTLGWGKTAHYQMNIDTTPPTLDASVSLTESDLIKVDMNAKDNMSGIANYKIYLDGKEIVSVTDNTYTLPPTTSGDHEITVRATDLAGNFSEKKMHLSVPAINTPVISDYPNYVETGKTFMVKGHAPYANTDVLIYIKEDDGKEVQHQVTSGADSNFSFMSDAVTARKSVAIYAETKRTDSLESPKSNTINIPVRKPYYLVIGSIAVDIFSVIVPLLVLLSAIIITIYFTHMRLMKIKNQIKRDLGDTESEIHSAFRDMHADITKHVKRLKSASKKRDLTTEEDELLNDLTEKLEDTEKLISKDFKNIKSKDL